MIPANLDPFTSEIIYNERTTIYFPYWSRQKFAFEIGKQYYLTEKFAFKVNGEIVYKLDAPEFNPGKNGWIRAGFMKPYRSRVRLELVSFRKCRFGDLKVTEYMPGMDYDNDELLVVFNFKKV